MKLAVLVGLGCGAGGVGLLILLSFCLRYAITDRDLRVTLFGLCLRRIQLSEIDHVSKRPVGRAEPWPNTLRPSHRVLVIHRKRGLFRSFMITPKNRYVFKADLERAVARLRAREGGRHAND